MARTVSWEAIKAKLYENDTELDNELKNADLEYEIIRRMIKAGTEQNITQKRTVKI